MNSLSKYPDSWQHANLESVVAVKGGKRLPKGMSFSDNSSVQPYIRVTDFKNFSVDVSDLRYISEEVHSKIARYTISREEVFISIAGSIGIVGRIPDALDGANLTENAAKLVINQVPGFFQII